MVDERGKAKAHKIERVLLVKLAQDDGTWVVILSIIISRGGSEERKTLLSLVENELPAEFKRPDREAPEGGTVVLRM